MARVSVLVRSSNDGALAGRTLEGLFSQEVPFDFEVLWCDDHSTDGTRETASRFPVRFVEPPEGAYMPGRTLNALVAAAAGDVVVFNNADAVPLDKRWLAELVAPLLAEPDRARATFANQLPRADARGLVRKTHARAFGDGKTQATWRFFFSLASSATWKRLLLEDPFDETIRYSEDVAWAWRLSRRKENPLELVYRPTARVEHSHNYTLRETARRFRGEGVSDRIVFGDAPALWRELAGAAADTARDWAWLAVHPRCWGEIPLSPVQRLVQHVSHWRGTREGGRR